MAKQSLSFALEPRATANFDDYVADCVWSPDSKSFAVAGGEGKVALARAEGDALTVETVGEHLLGALSIAWQPHGSIFATSGQDASVALWDGNTGKELKRWKPGASLSSPHMQLVLLKESSRWAMARYIFGALTGRAYRKDMKSRSADVSFVSAVRVRCAPIDRAERIRAQADGEMLGEMPVSLEILPNSLTLLMPKS